MGFIFISFAEVPVRCLCFPLSTYVIHAVNENHFKLGTWAVTKIQTLSAFREQQGGKGKGKKESMGAVRPQTPNQDIGWSQWARRLG